jgi:hypothetical protein
MTDALHALSRSIETPHPALFVLGAGTVCRLAHPGHGDHDSARRRGPIQGDVGFRLTPVAIQECKGAPEGCGMTGSGSGPSGLSAALELCSTRSDG